MVVGTDLHRAVPAVFYCQGQGLAALVQVDFTLGYENFTRRSYWYNIRSADGIMHGNQFGAVRKSGFDLYILDQFHHAVHYLVCTEYIPAVAH